MIMTALERSQKEFAAKLVCPQYSRFYDIDHQVADFIKNLLIPDSCMSNLREPRKPSFAILKGILADE